MLRYILKRILYMIPVLLGVIVIIFSIMYLAPGDAAEMLAGANATEEAVAAMRAKLGTDKPYIVQLVTYVKNLVLHGDLGTSYISGQSVTEQLVDCFPVTIKLSLMATVISLVAGITVGVVSAVRPYSVFDDAAQVLGLLGVSMPSFWLALMFIIVFSVNLGWFPSSGFSAPREYVLPAFALGLSSAAMIMRTTRSAMLDVINQDYIRTARAKGQSEFVIIMGHALKNAFIPILTVAGMQFGSMLGGSVMIETIFSIPGIGNLSVEAISRRNTPVVQGAVLLLAVSYSLINLLVDISYSVIDPRILTQYRSEKKRRTGPKKAKEARGDA